MLGLLVRRGRQFGDLTLSSIKRDIGIKDMDVIIPGHGGLLDRFDSCIASGPGGVPLRELFAGPGTDPPVRVLTGAR